MPSTSKIRAIGQFHGKGSFGDDTAHAVLDEVHFFANGAFSDDVVMRLEHFKPQLGQHGGHKVGLCVGEQWHGCHQLPTIEVDNFL